MSKHTFKLAQRHKKRDMVRKRREAMKKMVAKHRPPQSGGNS